MFSFTDTELLGVGLMLGLYVLIALAIGMSRWPTVVKQILLAGLALRVVGSAARNAMAADALVYYEWGREFAEYFARFDFSPIYDPFLWRNAAWVGSNFVGYPAGFIMAVIGPSMFGTFLGFALLAGVGFFCYAVAFRRAFPRANYARYWAWIFLFPSLWFWPSSIGKEAIMMLGLGIATFGFVGKAGRTRWILMIVGLGFVFAIRPPVVVIFLVALVLSYWLTFRDWDFGRFVQAVVILGVGITAIWYVSTRSEVGGLDFMAVEEFIEYNQGQTQQGGSAIETVELTPVGGVMAVVNVLFRPFPWEAANAGLAFSALEVLVMWGLIWFRRRQLGFVFKTWRRHRVLRFAVPFVLLYVIAFGFTVANLGIIARQRTLVFPLLFLIVEAGSVFLARPRWMRPPPGAVGRGRRPRPRAPHVST